MFLLLLAALKRGAVLGAAERHQGVDEADDGLLVAIRSVGSGRMKSTSIELVASIATVTSIVAINGWVLASKGAAAPRTRGRTTLYGVKSAVRVVGLLSALFFIAVPVYLRRDVRSTADWMLAAIFVVAALVGVWIASGSVTTDENGITKKGLWRSLVFSWDDITGIHILERQGIIKLRVGPREMIIDSRFVARDQLLRAIVDRSGVLPS